MPNGFYIKGTSYTYNVAGTDGRADIKTQFGIIKDSALPALPAGSDIIGCTTALLA